MSQHEHSTHDAPLVTIADDVGQLVEAGLNAERFARYDEVRRKHLPSKLHLTRHPSLLDQLRAAAQIGGTGSDGPMGAGYESRPAARIEAIDRLHAIDQDVDDWLVRKLNVHVQRDTLEDNLRALVGAASTLDSPGQHKLAREVCRWLTWARVVTGWESAPWKPNAPCPMCEARGGLRVRLEDREAACLECGETWDNTTIGLLADTLREANAAQAAHRAGLAELERALVGFFPRRGPCLDRHDRHDDGLLDEHGRCLNDARHRLVDHLVDRAVHLGQDLERIAVDHDLPVEAVQTAIAWTYHPARQTEKLQEAAS